MFRIGEFAQIAQVSTRQLRFYDQLGLLQPVRADAQTGYRYYSIRQLPRLNSILALKELGLSLEQIAPLLKDAISTAELRGMLTMKRAQVEQALHEEAARLRHTRPSNATFQIDGDLVLSAGELPAVETMATIVRQGANAESHAPFTAIGTWIEANAYEIAGPCREVFLEPVTSAASLAGALLEIQFPVRRGA
jgi:DNA-binding transcriptional MerR regulator